MTPEELGKIMLANHTREELEHGYNHSADDPAQVGRSALQWGDINSDGTLN